MTTSSFCNGIKALSMSSSWWLKPTKGKVIKGKFDKMEWEFTDEPETLKADRKKMRDGLEKLRTTNGLLGTVKRVQCKICGIRNVKKG